MNRQKLSISMMAGMIAIALPLAAALAAGGGNGGTSGGGSSGGGSSGGGSSSGGGGTLTITSDSDANADYQKAQSAIAGADYKTAADLLQKVLTRQPDNPDVLNLMGFSERKMGEASTALMYYKKALNLQPTHIGANEYLGELYLELKQPDMAEQRLAVLQQVCGSCEEYTELKEKIEKFKANPS
jgi:TolA-binding protein